MSLRGGHMHWRNTCALVYANHVLAFDGSAQATVSQTYAIDSLTYIVVDQVRFVEGWAHNVEN